MNAGGKCNGTWTRELRKEKSILDYFLIKKADIECYEKLEIDKDRIWAPYEITCIEKQTNVTYSDLNLMQATFNCFFQIKVK